MNIRRVQEQVAEMQRKYEALRLADTDKVVETAATVHAKMAEHDTKVAATHANIRTIFRAEKVEWLRFMEETRAAITELRTITQELAIAVKLPRTTIWQRMRAWFK